MTTTEYTHHHNVITPLCEIIECGIKRINIRIASVLEFFFLYYHVFPPLPKLFLHLVCMMSHTVLSHASPARHFVGSAATPTYESMCS